MVKRIVLLAVIALVAAGGFYWYLAWRPQAAGGDMLVLYGNVDIRDVELGFRVGGRIARMHAEEGDTVREGALLAQLDRRPFTDELALREAEIAQQTANLAKLEAGTRPAEIEQARALVAERRATLENARHNFARQQRLVKKDYASRQAYDVAAAQMQEAEARLRSAEQALAVAVEGFRQEEIAEARAALAAAKARRQIAQTAHDDTELRAPAEGVVLTRVAEPGAIVAAGATVYSLSLRRPVWVRAYVAEPDLGTIHPGMAVSVITDSRPDAPYAGQIGFISPVAEFTPKSVETAELRSDLVYRFRVLVIEPDEGLRQGMPVTVRIARGAEP